MTTRNLALRPLEATENDLLRRIVYTAATFRSHVDHPPLEELLAADHHRPYVEDWGRPGDRCIVATIDDEPVGGTFFRLFTPPVIGDGFVDAATPELGISLFAEHRSSGLGRALITALITQARLDGYDAISLGVADDNRAGELYNSVGFQLHKVIPGGRILVLPLKR